MSDVIKLSKEELEKLKEFKVKNDQIVDFKDFFWDPNLSLPPLYI